MSQMKRWVLARRPQGEIQPGDLEFIEEPIRELDDGEVLVRTVYLSLDPTNRIWMSDQDQYMPPVRIGETMRGGGIGVVERSRCERFKQGDVVNPGLTGWATHAIAHERGVNAVPQIPGVPLTAYMSVLGATGLTAWFGMIDIAKPQSGETVVVSAAAGAVGSIAGQLAKKRGARVIGIAGGPAKCAWLTGELGFDGAIDYKSEDVGAALDRLCPGGIDVDFENVGGEIMQEVYARMNTFGRMKPVRPDLQLQPGAGSGRRSSRLRPHADAPPDDQGVHHHRLPAPGRRSLRRTGPAGRQRRAEMEGPRRGRSGKRPRGGEPAVHRRSRRQAAGESVAGTVTSGIKGGHRRWAPADPRLCTPPTGRSRR